MWRRRILISATIAVIFTLSTVYVVWALKDLPDPNSGLAAGDIIMLEHKDGKAKEIRVVRRVFDEYSSPEW